MLPWVRWPGPRDEKSADERVGGEKGVDVRPGFGGERAVFLL